MPKMKTNRAAAKRFKLTGTGQIKRGKAYARHILTKKSRGRRLGAREGRRRAGNAAGGEPQLDDLVGDEQPQQRRM